MQNLMRYLCIIIRDESGRKICFFTGENTRCDADEYSVSKHCGSFAFFLNLNMYDWYISQWKNAKNLFSILQYSDTVRLHNMF